MAASKKVRSAGGGRRRMAGKAGPPKDPAIEALQLAPKARAAAYALKRAHPSIAFTSGRRSTQDQARAMAGNVVRNRTWIEQTYVPSVVRSQCQEWVDTHRDKKTKTEIAKGLRAVLDTFGDAALGRFSRHLSGNAFDVQPVEEGAEAIKETIRALPGLGKFLEKEGGLVRWHVQF
jgi:hypothetical protein